MLQGDLAKDVQVGAVQGPAEHPFNPRVIGVEKSLRGDAIRNHPHAQEEQEEENVLYLLGKHTRLYCYHGDLRVVKCTVYFIVKNHHGEVLFLSYHKNVAISVLYIIKNAT